MFRNRQMRAVIFSQWRIQGTSPSGGRAVLPVIAHYAASVSDGDHTITERRHCGGHGQLSLLSPAVGESPESTRGT